MVCLLRMSLVVGITVCGLAARGEILPVTFVIDPSQSNLSATISALGDQDADATALSGSLDANLAVDTSGDVPRLESIEFTGGAIAADDAMAFSLSFVFILPFRINLDITNVAGVPGTPIPPGPGPLSPLTPDNLSYEMDASFHSLTLNQGEVTVSGFDTIDLSEDPVSGTAPEGVFGTIQLAPKGDGQFDATMQLPIDFSDTFAVDIGIADIKVDIGVQGLGVSNASFFISQPEASDFDGDGDVDGDDFLIWQANFGRKDAPGRGNGDADHDGDVDGDDFLMWQTGFGSGALSAARALPEPAAAWLMLWAAAASTLARRRR